MTNTQLAFRRGYRYGRRHGEATAREASLLHAYMDMAEVESFCSGSIDGANADSWRYDRIGELCAKIRAMRLAA